MLIPVSTLAVHLKSNCIIMISSYGSNCSLTQEVNASVRLRPIVNNISQADDSIVRDFKNSLERFIISMYISNKQDSQGLSPF